MPKVPQIFGYSLSIVGEEGLRRNYYHVYLPEHYTILPPEHLASSSINGSWSAMWLGIVKF